MTEKEKLNDFETFCKEIMKIQLSFYQLTVARELLKGRQCFTPIRTGRKTLDKCLKEFNKIKGGNL